MSNLELEKKLWGKSFNYICGLDEVGRGCIAGPVYSGAVILNKNFEDPDDLFRKINDSKNCDCFIFYYVCVFWFYENREF